MKKCTITLILLFSVSFLPQKSFAYYLNLSPTDSCMLGVAVGLIYLEPLIPDLRFQKTLESDHNRNWAVVLSWPIHFIEFEPLDELYTSFFVEPAYVPAYKQFNGLLGSRITKEIFHKKLLILEGGAVLNVTDNQEYGAFMGLGYGNQLDKNFNVAFIARITKTNQEMRADISLDFWPHQYFKL